MVAIFVLTCWVCSIAGVTCMRENTIKESIGVVMRHKEFPKLESLAKDYVSLATNPMAILAGAISENTLTRLVGYLLDSRESHGLGATFFQEWAPHIMQGKFKREVKAIHVTTEWRTSEGRYVDIVAEIFWASGKSFALGIENKLWASEGPNQLKDYQSAMAQRLCEYDGKALVFLTPETREPETADDSLAVPVVPVGYNSVKKAVDAILEKNKNLPIAGFLGCFSEFIQHKIVRPEGIMLDAQNIVEEMVKDPAARKAIELLRVAFKENQTARNLFYENVLHDYELRKRYPEIRLGWYHPKTAPNEFNFSLNLPASTLVDNSGYEIYLMALVDIRDGEIAGPGSLVKTLIMAYKDGVSHKSQERESLRRNWGSLLKRLPPSRGTPDEWGPWVCLWSGGSQKLTDMSKKDGMAIAKNLLEAAKVAVESELVKKS